MKTELSPAAQAVMDALKDEWVAKPDEMSFSAIFAGLGAAALRAAADHLDAESPWPGHIESTGVNWSRNELHKIAAALEALPND